jgi:hypothetical protein
MTTAVILLLLALQAAPELKQGIWTAQSVNSSAWWSSRPLLRRRM